MERPTRPARWPTAGATLALLMGLVACAAPTADRSGRPAHPVEQVIADAALAACVATAAGLRDATGIASDADLNAIEQLHCDGQTSALGPVRSLEGIQHLSALTVLDAPRNEITDLTPLAALPRLGTLTLTDNAISDLSPLAGLALLGLGLGLVPLAGETLRHLIYGLTLSTSFTLLSRARARRRGVPASAALRPSAGVTP